MGLFDKLKGFNETDTEAAKRLYDKATSEYKAKNYYSAVRLYEMAWDKDPDVGTFFNLSCCYYFEWGTSKDEKRCYELTRHAALKDHPAAMNNLSFFLNTGYGCQEDRVEGRKWLERAANKNDVRACHTLAHNLHTEAKDDPKLLDRCHKLITRCATENFQDSRAKVNEWFGPIKEDEWNGMTTVDMYNRGCDWMNGTNGFTKNLPLAIRCFEAAAERNHAAAYCNKGWCLEQEGKYALANEAYLKGANLGNAAAMANLAQNLHNGTGWPKDDTAARHYLTMAQEAGSERATTMLAQFFAEPKEEPQPAYDEEYDEDAYSDQPSTYDMDEEDDELDFEDWTNEEKVEFMTTNMNLCVSMGFCIDECDVPQLAEELIDAEEYDLARKLLRSCLSVCESSENEDHIDEVRFLLAWVYYLDYDGNEEDNAPYYRLRLAYELIMLLGENPKLFGIQNQNLADFYDVCYHFGDDYDLHNIPGYHIPTWYGHQAYKFYSKAADDGYGYSMQMQAKYLMKEPSVVPSNYQKAEQLLTEAVNNIQALAFYLLGDLYYHSKYGRRNVEKAKECYINFINEEYCYDRYPYEYGQACHNAASILIDYDGSEEALRQARSILSEGRSHRWCFGAVDRLYGRMLCEGLGGERDVAEGRRLIAEACDDKEGEVHFWTKL